MGLRVKFFTFSKIHNKPQTGSTDIRVMNLLKHWDDASLYKFGQDYDVLIFQKVYAGQDYKMPINAKPIKILDIADPDWMEGALIVETVKAMDAVVTPTEPLAEYIRQFADCPVVVIKDRFNIADFPKPKTHKGEGKSAVWFGYSHNAETLRMAVRSLEKLGVDLTIIANKDPMPYRWAEDQKAYQKKYTYIPFDKDTLYSSCHLRPMTYLTLFDCLDKFPKFVFFINTLLSRHRIPVLL